MIIVHVLRKPLGEPSVAANVLRRGCGALNIDACRVRGHTEEMEGRSGTSERGNVIYGPGVRNPNGGIWQPNGSGRWPANVVLEHFNGCRPVGSVQLEGEARDSMTPTTHDAPAKFGYSPDRHQFNYQGETVETWDCSPGCPVADLDRQSGEGHSCRSTVPHGAYEGDSTTGFLRGHSHPGNQYADAGGASRFFRQFGGKR